MKNLMLSYSFICLILFTANQVSHAQQVNLRIDNTLVNSSSPGAEGETVYDVTFLRSECISLFACNPGKSAVQLQEGINPMDQGESSYIISTALLQSVVNSADGKRYAFSETCAENYKSNANVRVIYSYDTPNTPIQSSGQTDFMLELDKTKVLTVSGNDTPVGATGVKQFLKVLASPGNTATISINYDTNRGQVYVAIMSIGQGSKTLAMLNPKSTNNLSFTVQEDVFIVPILKPILTEENGETVILYEVGDPERNGKVRVEEAG